MNYIVSAIVALTYLSFILAPYSLGESVGKVVNGYNSTVSQGE